MGTFMCIIYKYVNVFDYLWKLICCSEPNNINRYKCTRSHNKQTYSIHLNQNTWEVEQDPFLMIH